MKEFDVCGVPFGKNKEYEHIPFYADNGLFDLGAILMNVNTSMRSDTAISSFISSMEWLNNNDFGWFGSYKSLVGDDFIKAVHQFVEEISVRIEGTTYSHYKYVKFSWFKVLLQVAAKIVYRRPVTKWGRTYVYDKKQMYFSMPTEEEFFKAAKNFVNNYFDMCAEPGKQIMIYDHLLWPQQTKLIDNYFDDNFKAIIVMRDARDLYNLNKNYWYKPPLGNGNPIFPVTPEEFADYWKRVRGVETANDNPDKVMFIQFEDLIYNYDSTVLAVMNFLGLRPEQHVFKKKYFDPLRSIKNTQTFTIKDEWEKEAALVGKVIPEYTYQFPYATQTSISEMFDTPGTTPVQRNSKQVNEQEQVK
ncbi:sulfotransferase domain-containing protein [Bacillus sp. T33-2]|uniref:sulfotransferase domain-containing protein n=1 Tax=Bacillus sp. T33-2 TaxID=2054168 RepID=UPI0015E083B3|nr:sulfotransferase domain-containing protein [Bacillus sp. T33-2]